LAKTCGDVSERTNKRKQINMRGSEQRVKENKQMNRQGRERTNDCK